MRPLVGAVTVTYNSAEVLPDFLASVDGLLAAPATHFFAVDNGSTDETAAMLASHSRAHLTVIENGANLGVAAANNIGIELALAAGCAWVLLVNNDTRFDSNLIAVLVEEAERVGARVITPVIEGIDPPGSLWFGTGRVHPWQGYRTDHPGMGHPLESAAPAVARPIGYAPTCCLLVRADVFTSVGLMDPDYFVYFDDVDFSVRAHRHGIEYWVTPAVTMLHKASSLTGGSRSEFGRWWGARNWVLVSRKNNPPVRNFVSLVVIHAAGLFRLATGRDSLADLKFRLRAYREGKTVATSPPPFPTERAPNS